MRPLGVTLVAIYQLARGLFQLLFALGVVMFTGLTAKLASLAAEGNALSRFLAATGKYLGLVVVVFAVFNLILAAGLWFMQNWARMLTVLFTAISLAALLPFLFHPRPFAWLFAILNLAAILYLMLPGTKRLFQGGAPPR